MPRLFEGHCTHSVRTIATGDGRLRTAYHERTIGGNHVKPATLCHLLRGDAALEVLLGRKKRGFGQGKLVGYGGKMKLGETPQEATVREFLEEARVAVRAEDLLPVGVIRFQFPYRPEYDHHVVVFLARAWEGNAVETEEMAPVWVPADRLPFDQMWNDDAYWLPRVLAGERIRASFTFGPDNETVTDWSVEPLADMKSWLVPF
jgi:8-oxo-dGTP diphosphatase